MDKSQKTDAAIELLVERGVRKSNAYPISHRLLRKAGLTLKPPTFSSFRALAWSFGIYFCLVWGIIMYFLSYADGIGLFFTASLSGLFFGLFMAKFFTKRRRDLNLPSWDEISEAPTV